MGCRKACSTSTTLLVVILAIVFVLALNQPVAHARHVRSPSTSTGEHSSVEKGSRGTSNDHGVEHTNNTETMSVEKGPTAQGTAGASLGRRGGSSSPAASAEKVVVVARYGPRPHPKKHN